MVTRKIICELSLFGPVLLATAAVYLWWFAFVAKSLVDHWVFVPPSAQLPHTRRTRSTFLYTQVRKLRLQRACTRSLNGVVATCSTRIACLNLALDSAKIGSEELQRSRKIDKFINLHSIRTVAPCDTTVEQGAIEIVPGTHRMHDYADSGYGSAALPGREHSNIGERERAAAAQGWE